jgi:HD-GYP domain-containing protein (c-di-GMP phosphodiesterase class II)
MAAIADSTTLTDALTVALGERDPYTRGHCARVVSLSIALGLNWGLDKPVLAVLRLAALVHDLGKIGIPDRILLKPGRLSAAERVIMQSHSVRGERILLASGAEGMAEVASVVRHHHERFDGGGYPDGLSGGAIPLPARIISVADTYDAMASRRPYQRSQGHERIMETMQAEQGRALDPQLFEAFAGLIETSHHRASPR